MTDYDPRAYYLLTVVKYVPRQSFRFLYSDFQMLNDRDSLDLPRAVADMVERGWCERVPAGLLAGVKLTELGEDVYLDAASIHEEHWAERRADIPPLSPFGAWRLEFDPHGENSSPELAQWRASDSPLQPDLDGFIRYGLVNYFGRTALGDEVLREWHAQHPEGHVIPEEVVTE